MIPVFLIALAGSGFAPEPTQDPGTTANSIIKVYDLKSVLPQLDHDGSWKQSLVVAPASIHSDLPSVSIHRLHEVGTADVVVDIVNQVLGDELRYEGREISLDGEDRLLVLAPGNVQSMVQNILDTLGGFVATSDEIRVDVLSLGEGQMGDLPAENVISSAQADQFVSTLVGRGAAHRTYTLYLGAGETAALDQMRSVPFLFDHDVEIAQGAFVFDPISVDAEEGTRLLIRGAPSPGGLSLSTVLIEAELLSGVKERPAPLRGAVGVLETGGLTQFDGPQILQTVEVQVSSLAFSTFLPDGQALLAASQTELGGVQTQRMVLIRRMGPAQVAAYRAAKLPGTSRSLLMVNSEVFNPPELKIAGGPAIDEYETHPFAVAEMQAEPSLFLMDWVKYRFSVWRRMGPWALIVSDPAWDNNAPEELEKVITTWKPETQNLHLDVTLTGRGSSTPVRWSLPVRAGTSCGLVTGITRTALIDFDVEVAQFSIAADPFVVPTFDGLAMGVEVATMNGSLTLGVRGTAHLSDGPIQSVDLKGPIIRHIDQPRFDHLQVDERITRSFRAGEAQSFQLGSRAQSEESGLSLTVGVR